MNRRQFCGTFIVSGAQARNLFGAGPSIDETLRAALDRRRIPAVVAKVATASDITYAGAFGKRDEQSGVNVTTDSIFSIASMTKAITSAAAMQLVERGKLKLDEPAAKYLPALSKLEVLDGFDKATGKPILRPAAKLVTLKHLLTHSPVRAPILRFQNFDGLRRRERVLETPIGSRYLCRQFSGSSSSIGGRRHEKTISHVPSCIACSGTAVRQHVRCRPGSASKFFSRQSGTLV